jgi:pimeloyl-ACP methyl ester carboxylesterase
MGERPGFYLPDFCRAQSVLAVILIAALVAILLTIARHGISSAFWMDLSGMSLFLLWAALGIAAAWCAARGVLSGLDVRAGSAVALALALAVTALVTEGAWWLASFADRAFRVVDGMPAGTSHLRLQLQNLAICAIAAGLALRYFYVAHQWQANVEAEAQSRVRALVEKQERLLRRVMGPPRDEELEAGLRTVQAPTLVLFGTEDKMIPPAAGHIYTEIMPRCHFVYVYDAGHAIALDRPEALASLVGEFIERKSDFVISASSTLINP